MLRVGEGVHLPSDANDLLKRHQAAVDSEPTYASRVDRAKTRWDAVKKRTPPFVDVKERLDQMCWGNRRCMYCEDSAADEIEHFLPKDLYPERCFVWENYLYACGPCNGPKNNQFGVIPAGQSQPVEVSRARGTPVVPPVSGRAALIDPRTEDPLAFLWLDIRETFWFQPRVTLTPYKAERAHYTIRTLRLNRPYLVEGRACAYTDRLAQTRAASQHRAHPRGLAALRRAIENTSHRSVWEEMKRQHEGIAELLLAFADAQELLRW